MTSLWCPLAGLAAVAAGASPGARPLRRSRVSMNILSSLFGTKSYGGDAVMGDESIMAPKAHGTSATPVQENLKWNCDRQVSCPRALVLPAQLHASKL